MSEKITDWLFAALVLAITVLCARNWVGWRQQHDHDRRVLTHISQHAERLKRLEFNTYKGTTNGCLQSGDTGEHVQQEPPG